MQPAVDVLFTDTLLEGGAFQPLDESYRSEDDWIYCRLVEEHPLGDRVGGPYFARAGGPHNLSKILHIFREWVIQQEK